MPPTVLYRLKVTLLGTKPPVWRRLELPADLTLAQLHRVLQIAMGWTDSHLHQFIQGDVRYGESDREFGLERVSEKTTTLADVLRLAKDAIDYEYDFGDSWRHRIVLEKVLDADDRPAPRVVDGKGACPPEDVGGIYGFATFVDAVSDPAHPEHRELRDWYGGPFDPAAFHPEVVNAALARLRLGPRPHRSKAQKRAPRRRNREWVQVAPPDLIQDRAFLERLDRRLADRTTILNDREVGYLSAEMRAMFSEAMPPEVVDLVPAEDLVRWAAVTATCEKRRKELRLSRKAAARRLAIPHDRLVAVEQGPGPGFVAEDAVRYFRLLGIETWFGRWVRANRQLARRAGLG